MPKRERRFEDELQELKLVPIMGLVVVLIPMLLLITVFVQIGVVNVSAPKVGVGAPNDTPEDEKKPLNLTIGISENGFTLAATGGVLPGQEIDPANPSATAQQSGPQIPTKRVGRCGPDLGDSSEICTEGTICPNQCGHGNICKNKQCLKWDYMALYNRMIEIKEMYPDETMVNLGADDGIPYGTLIATMDAVRVRRAGGDNDKFSKPEEFEAALPKIGKDESPELLFNDVVLAVIQ